MFLIHIKYFLKESKENGWMVMGFVNYVERELDK